MTVRTRSLSTVVLAATCAVLAACGSQIPPSKFYAAQGFLGGATQSAANNGTGGGTNNNTNGGGTVIGPTGTATGTATAGPGGTLATGAAGGPTTSAAGGGGTGGGGTTTGAGAGAAAGDTLGSCAGFTNGTGITSSAITLANVADVSGPVPGLFAGAQQAMKAYVAYFNSTVPNGICGRKLALNLLDSQTSSTGDQQAATTACGSSFAMVGSMGAFDDGGAQTVGQCGIPDLRSAATEQARINVPNVFGAMSLNAAYIPTEPAKYYESAFPGTTDHAAMLWLAAGAAQLNGTNEMKGFTQAGMHFVYSAGIDVTAFNYATYVAGMQQAGVKWVEFVGAIQYAVRLAQAMQQQNFHPIFVLDPEFYDPSFVQSGGSAVNGVHIWVNQVPFEEVGSNPEMQKYELWLQRTNPGAKPNYFGLFSWAAGALFVKEALALGGQLTRANLIAKLKAVDNFTGNGLFGPQHVGAKETGSCYGFIKLNGTTWVREAPASGQFTCGTVVKVS